MQIQRLVKIIKQLSEDFTTTQYAQRINEFISTLGQAQNKGNISVLKGVGEMVTSDLIFIDDKSYSEELYEILGTLSVQELYNEELLSEFQELQENPDVTAAVYHQKLNQLLVDLRNRFNAVNALTTKITTEFGAFDNDETQSEFDYTNDDQAVIGLHLINKQSYEYLGSFTELMNEWDSALYYYSRCANVDTDNLKPRVSSFRNGSVWAELIVSIGVASDIISIYNAGIGALSLYKEFKDFLDQKRNGVKMDAFDKIDEGLNEMKNQIIDAIKSEAKTCLEKHKDCQSVEVGANAISNVIYGNIVNGNNITLIDSSNADEKIIEENQKLREKVRKLEANQELLDEIKLLVDSPIPEKDYTELDKNVKPKPKKGKK